MTETTLAALKRCDFCAKKTGAPNCICYHDQQYGAVAYRDQGPKPEEGADGNPVSTNCAILANQNTPGLCTCTRDPQWGSVLDYPVYHFPRNFYDKNEVPKLADLQTSCKYERGMGAYIGLFGSRGIDVPVRVYHLFTEEEICNVAYNSQGLCVDDDGNDITRYIFRSANQRIFMKNDANGNNGTDTNTADDDYHKPNESIKVIIYDRYYNDNYGGYNLTIMRGVGNNDAGNAGLMEFLVSMVEDVLMGTKGDDGVRHGGIIEFMYKSIVQDTGFILVLQLSLSLYITFYGFAHLFGLAEINKKELMTRVLKIGLIILFTNKDSWYFYNRIIVAFFKDSMDYVVAMMMDLTDRNTDPTSMVKIAQMDRNSDYSQATRFSYVDLIIKRLLSEPVAKKIFGLVFGAPFFGLLYIPLIFALIAAFILVMLLVAVQYITNVMKLIFVLALGPIFMCFTLFSQTSDLFKKWLSFLGSRALQIILLFTILYNFLILIDKGFTDLLNFRACTEDFAKGPLTFLVLVSETDRPLMVWLTSFITIAGFIFIMKLVIDKVEDIAGALISIGGTPNSYKAPAAKDNGFNPSAVMGAAMGLAKSAGGALAAGAATAGRYGLQGATAAARASGAAAAMNKLSAATGITGPRTAYGNSIIDSAINTAKKEADAKGLTGAKADAHVRQSAFANLQGQIGKNPNSMALAGVDATTIASRFDQKLVQEPLKDFIKAEAAKLKNLSPDKIPLGKDMRQAIRAGAMEFAKNNFSVGNAGVKDLLKGSLKDAVRSNAELTSSEAASRFAGKPDLQNKFMQHLKDNEFRQHRKDEEARKTTLGAIGNMASKAYNALGDSPVARPKLTQEDFSRRVGYEEQRGKGFLDWAGINTGKGFDPTKRMPMLDKFLRSSLGDKAQADQKNAMEKYLASKPNNANDKAAKRDEERRAFYQNQLKDAATKGMNKELNAIRALEKNGQPDKMKEAADRKRALFDQVKSGLDAKDGKSLYEKAAALAHLQQQFGLKGKDAREALSKAMSKEVKDTIKYNELALKNGSRNGDQAKDKLDKLSSFESGLFTDELNTKKSASEILREQLKQMDDYLNSGAALSKDDKAANEKSDREAAAALLKDQAEARDRLEEANKKIAEAAEKAAQVKDAFKDGASEESKKAFTDALVNEFGGKDNPQTLTAEDRADKAEKIFNSTDSDEKKQESIGLIAKSFEVEFGSSLADFLPTGPDLGLKAGQPLLGIPDAKGEVNEALKNALKAQKGQTECMSKLAKMNVKVSEYELSELKKDPEKNKNKIAEVEARLQSEQKEAENLERQIADINANIDIGT